LTALVRWERYKVVLFRRKAGGHTLFTRSKLDRDAAQVSHIAQGLAG
jgi:hypothetical protein